MFTTALSNGSVTNSISLPGYMWDLIDAAATKHDWTRSVYCKRAIMKALMLELVNNSEIVETVYKKMVETPN